MLRHLSVLMFALIVALSAAMPSGRWFQCRMDGSLHETCCCVESSPSQTPGDADRPCSSHRGSCCDIVILPDHPDQQTAAMSIASDDGPAHVAALDLVGPGPLLADLSEWISIADRPARSYASLPSAPQLYQRFCSYLI